MKKADYEEGFKIENWDTPFSSDRRISIEWILQGKSKVHVFVRSPMLNSLFDVAFSLHLPYRVMDESYHNNLWSRRSKFLNGDLTNLTVNTTKIWNSDFLRQLREDGVFNLTEPDDPQECYHYMIATGDLCVEFFSDGDEPKIESIQPGAMKDRLQSILEETY